MSEPLKNAVVPQQDMILALEKAARLYCGKAGIDADVEIPEPHPAIAGAVVKRRYWEIVAERMVDLGMLLIAMKEAGSPASPVKH